MPYLTCLLSKQWILEAPKDKEAELWCRRSVSPLVTLGQVTQECEPRSGIDGMPLLGSVASVYSPKPGLSSAHRQLDPASLICSVRSSHNHWGMSSEEIQQESSVLCVPEEQSLLACSLFWASLEYQGCMGAHAVLF